MVKTLQRKRPDVFGQVFLFSLLFCPGFSFRTVETSGSLD
jgi:hypothetical protein